MSIQIDGKKFIVALGLDENTLTSIQVREALANLTQEERENLVKECTVVTTEDKLPSLIECLNTKQNQYIECDLKSKSMSDVEVKRRLKYEKNYLAQQELRYQLGPSIGERGKHSRGCKRKRKK